MLVPLLPDLDLSFYETLHLRRNPAEQFHVGLVQHAQLVARHSPDLDGVLRVRAQVGPSCCIIIVEKRYCNVCDYPDLLQNLSIYLQQFKLRRNNRN